MNNVNPYHAVLHTNSLYVSIVDATRNLLEEDQGYNACNDI
jgi:hypothetical protein